MRPLNLSLTVLLFASSLFAAPHAEAQSHPAPDYGLSPGQVSLLDVTGSYDFFHANAPPTTCGCFSLEGGGGSVALNMPKVLSFVLDVSAAHASHLNGTPQSITILDVLAGPRVSFRSPHRITPYAQVLLGASRETSNYAAVHDVAAFAVLTGVGFTTPIAHRFQWNILEADYVFSQLPNAVNNYQNDLRITTGFTLRLGPR